METAQLQSVRRFNRIATERAGALGEGFLGLGRPLGEARLLWEIGAEGSELRELRARLGLDSGYVSRLVRSLERDGLVEVERSRDDGRVRRLELTERGRSEWNELDARSDALAASVLAPLDERRRAELVDAMHTVERLLTASAIRLEVEDPRSADARWCIEQYFRELDERFDAGFDPAATLPYDVEELTPPAGVIVVARLRGSPVACGTLKLDGAGPAYLKRMWVSPSVRGVGLARRLLAELEEHARGAGASSVQLETNRSLVEAIALYRSAGYREVAAFNGEPYADHWFEKRL
jgi:DNA-binding MarR family transcriptional regulator/GNAT superfamily N-acetyltransferase